VQTPRLLCDVVKAAIAGGCLVPAGPKVIRFVPPLIVDRSGGRYGVANG